MAVNHKPTWLECDIATELEQLVHLDALGDIPRTGCRHL